MKPYAKILFGVAALSVLAAVVYKLQQQENNDYMLTEIADQGYETAHDVLYPRKNSGGSKLHYGPVHPGLN